MKVFSEETIFHRTVWTTAADNFASGDRAHSPCPPSTTTHSHDNSGSFNRNFDPVKKILAPPSTLFARDCSEFLLRPTSPLNSSSIRPISPPGSPLPSPLPAFRGFGFGPHGGDSKMGLGIPGGEKRGSWENNNNAQRFADEPIKLAPIHLPFDGNNAGERLTVRPSIQLPSTPMHIDRMIKREENEIETSKERKVGVVPVSFKKKKNCSQKNSGKVAGIFVVQTTTTTTTSPNSTLSVVAPPAQFSQSTTSISMASLMNPAATNTTTSTVPQQQPQQQPRQHTTTQHNNSNDNGNRRRVTPEQLAVLEREFECGMIPDLETRKRVAKQLGFTERRVQVWFQNRRAKMKKDNHSTPIFIINCGIESFKN